MLRFDYNMSRGVVVMRSPLVLVVPQSTGAISTHAPLCERVRLGRVCNSRAGRPRSCMCSVHILALNRALQLSRRDAGAGSPSTAVANLVGSLAVLLSTLFGGFLLSRKQMPPLVGWLARLSFVRSVCLLPSGSLVLCYQA